MLSFVLCMVLWTFSCGVLFVTLWLCLVDPVTSLEKRGTGCFAFLWFVTCVVCPALTAHLSTKCSRWAIVIGQCTSSVVRRQQFALKKTTLPTPLGPLTWNLVGSIGVACRSKIAKIVSIGSPGWPPWCYLENLVFSSSPEPKSQLTRNS